MPSEDDALLRYAPTLARFTKDYDDGTTTVWVLGPLGAVSLQVMRPRLPEDWPEGYERTFGSVDRHSPTPRYEDETPHHPCHFLEGSCYCDGSALMGMDMAERWVAGDEEGIWDMLTALYVSWLAED